MASTLWRIVSLYSARSMFCTLFSSYTENTSKQFYVSSVSNENEKNPKSGSVRNNRHIFSMFETNSLIELN